MKFRDRLTVEQTQQYEHVRKYLPTVKDWYWVTVDEDDLKNKVHIHVYAQENGQPYKFQRFSENSCLAEYAKLLESSNFQFSELQHDFDQISEIANNLDHEKLTTIPWVYLARNENGPYMIGDSIHRELAAYIYYFIWNKSNFKPIDHAICGISQVKDGDLTRIPQFFCN